MNKIQLHECLRAGVVPRWTIVPNTRQQSVAEHSYNVWLITQILYDTLYPIPHNTLERDLALEYALIHDLAEALTGDIPSPAKKELRAIAPGAIENLEVNVLNRIHPKAVGIIRGAKGTVAEAIVKTADILEGLLYISKFGADGGEAFTHMKRQFWEHIDQCCAKFRHIDWSPVVAYAVTLIPDFGEIDPD